MIRHLKDLGLLVKSLFNAAQNVANGFYWNDANVDELDKLVERLSNPNVRERQIIREILRKRKPARILDAGCGHATELEGYRLNRINIDYVGLDKSYYMLGVAKERHPATPFVRGDINVLPFGNDSFDVVLLKHILEHLPEYQVAIKEALRVSSNLVIINFFHRLLPTQRDIYVWHRKGYWDNWFSRPTFHRFLDSLPLSHYERIATKGTVSQTAEIYILEKDKS